MKNNSTLSAIEASLPNGFHDALINSISVDYTNRKIVFSISVWTGDVSAPTEEERESYSDALLTVSDFLFCVIEPPDTKYPFSLPQPLRVDFGTGNPQETAFFEDLPREAFAHWFFVNEWNSFIYFAARSAHFERKTDK